MEGRALNFHPKYQRSLQREVLRGTVQLLQTCLLNIPLLSSGEALF
jgi:hypothetical protein